MFQEDQSEDELATGSGSPTVTTQPTSSTNPFAMPAPPAAAGDASTAANESTSLNIGDKTVYTPGKPIVAETPSHPS